jgi:uncharacterized protein
MSLTFPLPAHTHLLTLAGSRAYGLHRPDSDVDLRGVAIAPARFHLGFLHTFEQADDPGELAPFHADLAEEAAAARDHGLEGTVYGLAKFMRLAADCNPNILDVLFGREAEIRRITPLGRALREHRRAFLSRRARHSYAGYAGAQLKRIEGHRAWLLDPPEAPPTRAAYGLPEHATLPADQRTAAFAAVDKQLAAWGGVLSEVDAPLRARIRDTLAEILAHDRWTAAARAVGLEDSLIEVLSAERRYRRDRQHWKQYQRWRRNRNPERAELEARYGYDTKHGMHLVRLLRMGRELLEEGALQVWRGDRDAAELLAIRRGAWSYERLREEVDREEARLAALEEDPPAPLPRGPDRPGLDALCVRLTEAALSGPPYSLD